MRHKAINADKLFAAFRQTLGWHWEAGQGNPERRFDEMAVRSATSGADLVGYLNYIHPYRLQVLGEREIAYLTNATPADCERRVQRITNLEPRFWCWPMGKPPRRNCWPCASATTSPCSPRTRPPRL